MPFGSLYYVPGPVVPTPGLPMFFTPVSNGSYVCFSILFLCMIPFGSFAWFPMAFMPVTQWFLCLIPIGFFWFLMSPMSMSVSLQFLNLTSSDYCACFPAVPLPGLGPILVSPWFLCPIPYGFYIWFPLVPMPHSPWFLYMVLFGSYARFPMVLWLFGPA